MSPSALLQVLGRVLLSSVFLITAVASKIPRFASTAESMAAEQIPSPRLMLVGAIAFLIAGSMSLILGFKARIGALLLLVFLVLATYFYHDFWAFQGAERELHLVQFLANVSLAGGLLLVIAGGAGPASVDACMARRRAEQKPG
ncbi:MAG: DoxX family protein [Phycisphaerales bacterium JB039]